MYVCRVRLRDFSHLEWQKLNINYNNTLVKVRLPRFRSKSSRFVKLVQYNSYLTTVVEAQVSRLLISKIAVKPTTFFCHM